MCEQEVLNRYERVCRMSGEGVRICACACAIFHPTTPHVNRFSSYIPGGAGLFMRAAVIPLI